MSDIEGSGGPASLRAKPWPSVSHYYGDPARQLLLGAAALMLFASPLYGNNLRAEFPLEVIGALVIVAFSALMNPRQVWIMIGGAIVSGLGAAVYAAWGLFEYDAISPIAFVLRLAVAVILLFAFYFSVKTIRAFMLHQIGKREPIDEFESNEERARTDTLERETRDIRPEDVR